jgi:hypothetical protein
MPATSKAQQIAMAIAEHAPGKLYARNKGMLGMTHQQLHDFAATKRKGLPARAPKAKKAAAAPKAPGMPVMKRGPQGPMRSMLAARMGGR